jgi:DnaK suppressor protein
LKKSDPYLDTNSSDSGNTLDDDITEIEGHDRITATRLQMKQDLAGVENALKRIEDGTYGKCQVGGEDISVDRLEAMPTATVCLAHTKN